MANNLVSNPVYIDTAGADVAIHGGDGVRVSMISVTEVGGTADLKVTFIDNDGNVAAIVDVTASNTTYWVPSEPFWFLNGLNYDDSASDTETNDIILVYVC